MNPPPSEHTPRKGRRQRIVELAEACGITRSLKSLHDRGRKSVLILAYHRVVPIAHPDDYALDPELVSATPAEFDWQMSHLRQHMNPVSLGDVVAHLDDGRPLPSRAVVVTFDDGYRDTHDRAFPILLRHRIPATVFAVTGCIDSGEPFWFEVAARLMMSLEPDSIRLAECPDALPFGPRPEARRDSLQALHRALKSMDNARRTQIVDAWRARFTDLLATSTGDLLSPMTWDDVSEMSDGGIEFGAHTVTHPNLAKVPDDELAWELSESRRVLEHRTGRPVRCLAYPIGTESAFDARVMRASEAAGYRLAVSYLCGANWAGQIERFGMRRHGVSLNTTRSYFRALLDLPDWLR